MGAPKHVWRGICEYPLTEEYERGHEQTFGKNEDAYCPQCDRLPAFCECHQMERDAIRIERIEGRP